MSLQTNYNFLLAVYDATLYTMSMRIRAHSPSEHSFVNSLERVFIQEGYFTKREIGAGHGIADLVLARLNPLKSKLRNKYSQKHPLLKEGFFKVLKYIPDEESSRKAVSIYYLHEKTRLSTQFIKYELLNTLQHYGYVKSVEGNKYLKINGWAPIADEVIAIEAKLRDWKRAFIQANRYKSFADKAYVAIPEEIAHLPDRDIFRRFKVGLYAFDLSSKKLRLIIPARKSKEVVSEKRNLISEYFWS